MGENTDDRGANKLCWDHIGAACSQSAREVRESDFYFLFRVLVTFVWLTLLHLQGNSETCKDSSWRNSKNSRGSSRIIWNWSDGEWRYNSTHGPKWIECRIWSNAQTYWKEIQSWFKRFVHIGQYHSYRTLNLMDHWIIYCTILYILINCHDINSAALGCTILLKVTIMYFSQYFVLKLSSWIRRTRRAKEYRYWWWE